MAAPISSSATVTMPMHDFRRIEREVDTLREQIATFQKQFQEGAIAGAVPSNNADFGRALRCALEVVAFAVANAPPEAHHGWPWQQLHELGELLRKYHNELLDPDQLPLALTFMEFSRECEEVERFRSQRAVAAVEVLAYTADNDAEDLTPSAESVE